MLIIIIAAIVAIALFALFLRVHSRQKRPAKSAILHMSLGSAGLVIAAIVTPVAVNVYTMFAALTLGIPGTVLVVLGNLLL